MLEEALIRARDGKIMNHIEEFAKAMEKAGYKTRKMRNGNYRWTILFFDLVYFEERNGILKFKIIVFEDAREEVRIDKYFAAFELENIDTDFFVSVFVENVRNEGLDASRD